jgi:hypothetical protein
MCRVQQIRVKITATRDTHRIFLVTTAMTSSWAAAERRKVTNMARERENWYEMMAEA